MALETLDNAEVARRRAEARLAVTNTWRALQEARKTMERQHKAFLSAASRAVDLGISYGEIKRETGKPVATIHRWITDHKAGKATNKGQGE